MAPVMLNRRNLFAAAGALAASQLLPRPALNTVVHWQQRNGDHDDFDAEAYAKTFQASGRFQKYADIRITSLAIGGGPGTVGCVYFGRINANGVWEDIIGKSARG